MPFAAIPAVLFAIVAVLDQFRPVAAWNDAFSIWLQGPEEYALTVLGIFTDVLFSGQVVLGLAIVICGVLALRRRWLMAASAALVFPLVFVEVALKYLVAQPPASQFLHIRVLFPSGAPPVAALEHGFPSGHAARTAFVVGWLALLLVPARWRLPVGGAAVVLTMFIAWTRIYVGDHSLLEIVAGLLLAAVFLPLAAALTSLAQQPAR